MSLVNVAALAQSPADLIDSLRIVTLANGDNFLCKVADQEDGSVVLADAMLHVAGKRPNIGTYLGRMNVGTLKTLTLRDPADVTERRIDPKTEDAIVTALAVMKRVATNADGMLVNLLVGQSG